MTTQDNLLPALYGTDTLNAEQALMRRRLADAANVLKADKAEQFSNELDAATAEQVALALASEKDKGEAKLSYALFVLKETRAHLNAGYATFAEYVENKIRISGPRASALAARWAAFIELGLPSSLLVGDNAISWSKFGALVPGIKTGLITAQSVDTWLPLVAAAGEFALTETGITKLLKAEIAANKAEDDPEQLEALTIRLTADDKAHVLNFINTIEEATGILGAGSVVRSALEARITEIATNSEDVRRNYGLARFKEIAERMVPGIKVVFIAEPTAGYTKENLGVVPYTRLYADRSLEGVNIVLASSYEEAAETLGTVDAVYDISVPGAPQTVAARSDEAVPDETAELADTQELIAEYTKEIIYHKLDTRQGIAASSSQIKEQYGEMASPAILLDYLRLRLTDAGLLP